MENKKIIIDTSLENKNVYYKLNTIFILFFIFPTAGIIYFIVKYDILHDKFFFPILLGGLVYLFVGFSILRKMFDRISSISREMSQKIHGNDFTGDVNELHQIVEAFNSLEEQFKVTSEQLHHKTSEISVLKELSDLCSVTLDSEEILYVTLERALMLTQADIGSIMILKELDKKVFVVKASMGLGDFVKINDRVDFETSIAKYAVINKSPLLVEDIEKESRFGRANRMHYGSKSFICMPIKTIKDIIGVLTISSKDDSKVFSHDDIEILTPLLSNSAFTYENIRLFRQLENETRYQKSLAKIFSIINSSLKDSELLHSILMEIQLLVGFNRAVILMKDTRRLGYLMVNDVLSSDPLELSVGDCFNSQGSMLDRVMQQESSVIVEDTGELISELETKLFAGPNNGACLLAPLMIGGASKGVLVFSSHEAMDFYSNKRLIDWLANVLALALEHNNLSRLVVKRTREFATLKQLGSALAASTFDLDQVLRYTMDMIREIMNVEAGVLFLLNEHVLEYAAGFNLGNNEPLRLKLGQGIAGTVAAQGKSVTVNDIKESKLFNPEVDNYGTLTTRSTMCIPIISQARVIGVIQVLNKNNGGFSGNDEELLQSIASSVNIALENARLYKETVSMADHERGIRKMFEKFVPKGVLDQIVYGEDSGKVFIEEFKTLTLLNIDLRGFSKLVKNIGPQKTVSLLNHFFSVMGGIVFMHQGIVDKYLGDGFLAVFGAPVSSIMDAENGVAAALEMQKSVAAVNDYITRELGTSVNVGISIHTGEVVVGNIGFEKKMDYTVIGDPVNAVFRLQELTKSYKDGILISEDTLRACRSRLDVKELDEKLAGMTLYELKGWGGGDIGDRPE
jgi:class 3 adenylate cyclase/putative methionine-R-sulfoxide reductase with GAF domain